MTTPNDSDPPSVASAGSPFVGVVYELLDPRDGRCRYVGQTFDADQRRRTHTSRTPIYQQNTQLHNWKTELALLGMAPEFRVIEDCIPAERINEQESFWCRDRADDGCELLNRPVGSVRKGDLLGSPRRHEMARTAREIRQMLMALEKQGSGKLPAGKGPMRHLGRCISELLDFIHAIDD
jgi:hypothetical protein